MSPTSGPSSLTFSLVMLRLRAIFEKFPDQRTGKNVQYKMVDAGLSAFSMLFMQSPSFLDFQRTMQKTQGKNNVQTLFGAFDPDGHPKLHHLWPPKLHQAGRPDYGVKVGVW